MLIRRDVDENNLADQRASTNHLDASLVKLHDSKLDLEAQLNKLCSDIAAQRDMIRRVNVSPYLSKLLAIARF